MPDREVVTVVSLLQTVVLARSTGGCAAAGACSRAAQRLLAAVPGGEVAPVQLERIRLRTLVTLVATVVAAYLLAGELARDSLSSMLRSADWRWGIVALAPVRADLCGGDAVADRVRDRAASFVPRCSPRSPARSSRW